MLCSASAWPRLLCNPVEAVVSLFGLSVKLQQLTLTKRSAPASRCAMDASGQCSWQPVTSSSSTVAPRCNPIQSNAEPKAGPRRTQPIVHGQRHGQSVRRQRHVPARQHHFLPCLWKYSDAFPSPLAIAALADLTAAPDAAFSLSASDTGETGAGACATGVGPVCVHPF